MTTTHELIEPVARWTTPIANPSDLGGFVAYGDYLTLLRQVETLQRERDAILMQARIWAQEAKAQKHTVDQVGAVLGGIPDWGPIAASVDALKRDAERYRWLREATYDTAMAAMFDFDGPTPIVFVRRATVQLDRAIDAAIASLTKPATGETT